MTFPNCKEVFKRDAIAQMGEASRFIKTCILNWNLLDDKPL